MIRIVPLFVACLTLIGCPDRRQGSDDDDDATDDDDAVDDDDAASGLPSAPGVMVEPPEPDEGDALICFVTTDSIDPQGRDVAYAYAWAIDGAPSEYEASALAPDITRGGEVWLCSVTPTAGEDVGEVGTDSVTINVPNRAPGMATVSIDPPAPRSNQPARCVIGTPAEDPDGDTLEYAYDWQMAGISQGITDPVLPATATLEGQSWVCSVTASDGELTGPAAQATTTIGAPEWTPDVTNQGVDYYESNCFSCPANTWYIADKAFDDNTGTGPDSWQAYWTGSPEWVAVDFGEGTPKTITRYGLMGAAFHEGYRAVDWQLQGSNDGTGWTDLHTVVGANLVYVMWGGEPFTYYDFDNTAAWQHYRIHVTANAGGQQFSNEVGIVEIEMFENAP
jgi:hypothetical protein